MISRSLLLFTVATYLAVHTSSQYVDFLQGLQSFFQPYQLDGLTTRRPETRKHGSRQQNRNPTNPTILFPDDHSARPKTTVKPKKSSRPSSQSSRPKSVSRYDSSTPYSGRNENRKTDFSLFSNDNIFFPDDDVTTNSNRKNSQWGNKNDNRNPTVTTQQSNNRNPTSTQNKKNNRNPVTTQSGNRNENRNPDVTNIQWGNQNPVSASLSQWNNRNPTVTTQYGNKNDHRNPDVSNIQLGQDNRGPVSASLTQWNKNDNRNPDVTITKRPGNRHTGTTRKPLTSRPGVRPAPVDESRPPITNKPVEDVFPVSSNDEPELEIGPDEDDMTSVQKRQYLAMAEQMCDTYKALNVKKVVALPLVPSPEGVEFNVSDCTPINIPLIIGGTVSNIEEFPHMSLVGWKKVQSAGYSWKCGGSLISDQYVLTAGHCTYHEKDYNVVSGPPHAVQLGSTYVDGPGAVVVRSASVIRHPKYKQRRSYYDVALIKLVSRVKFSDTIKPACLGVPPPVGKPIIATGWGRTEFGGDQSLELRSVSLPIWDMQECKEIWGTSLKLPNGPSSESHVCAGERAGGKDTCQGDSGGPAQIQEGCIWRVVAVTSSGRSCGAPDTPALYATVPRVFVAAEVFGKKSSDNRYNNQINSNNYQTNNRNNQNNNNVNYNSQTTTQSWNRNNQNQNNRVNVNYNSQTTQNWNQNQPTVNNQNSNVNSQNNWNQNNYEYQNGYQSNLNNQNTNQYYQSNTDYNKKNNQIIYNEAITRNPNQNYNYQESYNQNSNRYNQKPNGYNQNSNPNQYYQNGYENEGWNSEYNRGIYDYNIGDTDHRTTGRPWWSR